LKAAYWLKIIARRKLKGRLLRVENIEGRDCCERKGLREKSTVEEYRENNTKIRISREGHRSREYLQDKIRKQNH